MNLPIQLHYRASFDVSEPYMKGDLWLDCTKTLRKWISHKVHQPPESDFWRNWFFRGGDWQNQRCQSASIRTGSLIGTGTDAAPQYWALSYRHPCGQCNQRMWQTDIGITILSDDRLRFNTQTGHYMRANFLGKMPENPDPSAPGIVQHLLSDNRWRCEAGSQELLARPEVVRVGSADKLVASLRNPERACPVVVVTKNLFTQQPSINAGELQRLLAGAGSVYLLDSPEVEEEFEFLTAHRYRCNEGMVRVYLPGMDFASEQDGARHRFFFPKQIEDVGAQEVIRQLVSMICRFAPRRKGQSIFALDELESLCRSARLKELRDSKAEGDQSEWIELVELEMKGLEDQKLELEKERDDLQLQVLEREDRLNAMEYEIKTARNESAGFYKKRQEMEKQLSALTHFKELPETLPEVLKKIGQLFADRVVITTEAIKAAEDYDEFQEIPTAWKCLWAMATELHRLHFEETGSKNIEKEFHEKAGFELSLNEGRMTQRDGDLMRLRQVRHNGQTLTMTPHVKWGNKEPKCLRIYYATCSDEKKLIIGHCGPHLENRTSSKIK